MSQKVGAYKLIKTSVAIDPFKWKLEKKIGSKALVIQILSWKFIIYNQIEA